MELNINSLSARVYREVYNTRHMPESLCPYFWKLVLAYPLIVVLLPLLIPTWIMMKFQKDEPDTDVPIGAKALIGVLIYGFVFIVFAVGMFISSYWITYYQGTAMYSFYVGGSFISLILGVTGIVLWVIHLIDNRKYKRKFNNEYVEQKPNLIVEFVKAKYNKYCPKITWK
jgi:hypothetical protein